MDKLRVAVIGCGAIGKRHAEAVRQSDHAELIAACDVEKERADAIAGSVGGRAYRNVEALLKAEAPDAVTVATPDHLHVAPTVKALEAGCHVFCEKPLAMTREEAQFMQDTAARCGRHLAVDYNRRFGFGYQKAKMLCESRRIGRITHALIRVTDGIPAYAPERGHYAIYYILLPHHIDLLRWFCGEIKSVAMVGAPPGEDGLIRDAILSLRFAGTDAVGVIVGGYRAGQTRTHEWAEIGGTEGVVQVEDVQQRVRWHERNPDEWQEFRPNYFRGEQTAFYDSLRDHVQVFLARIQAGEAPPVTAQDGLRGLRIIEAAIQSHQTGQQVEV